MRCLCVLYPCVHGARRAAQGSPRGQSTRAGPHPASPRSPGSPVAGQRAKCGLTGPPSHAPERRLLPRGLWLVGCPLLPGPVPGQWTVLARVALVPPPPACTVCRRAVTARMPSASAPAAARAVPTTLLCALPWGGGALGPRPLWWGQIGPSCGPGRQGWGRHARPKGMSRPGPDGEARGARCPRAEAARSEWGRTPRGRGEAGGGEQGPWDPAATQCPGGWRFGSGPPDRPGQCTVTAPVAQGLALPPQLGEGHPRALRPRHSEVLRGVAVVAARGLWAPEALAPQRPPAAGSVWKGGRDRGSRSEALLTEARGHGAGQRAQTCPEFLLTQGWGAAAKEWARHGDLRGAAGSGHLASPCPGPCPLACPRPPVPGCLSS